MKKNIGIIVTLLFLSFLTYFNSLHNAFMMDDGNHFVANYHTHNIKNLFFAFASGKGLADSSGSAHFRPLRSVLQVGYFALFHYNPTGYHVLNCFLFAILCIFIFIFLSTLTRQFWVAGVTAILFCVHPINGMLVNYITANVLIVQLIFMAASLWLMHKSIIYSGKGLVKWGMMGLAGIFYLLSCLCHETAYFLPFYAAALCLMVHRLSIRQTFKYCALFFIILGFILLFRMRFSDVGGSYWKIYQTMGISPWQFIATVSKAWFWYVSQLFYPRGVVLIWGTPVVVQGAPAWITALLFFFIIMGWMIIKWMQQQIYVYGFLLLFFILGIIPVFLASLSFSRVGIVLEPHWLFFNSIGFFALTAWLLDNLGKKVSTILTPGLIASMVVALISQSWVMNNIWSDEINYCNFWRSHILTKKFDLIDGFQANAYFNKKNYSESYELFNKSLGDLPNQWKYLVNLGVIAANEKKIDLAVTYFKKAIAVEPHQAISYSNLGAAYRDLENNEMAKIEFEKAMALDPDQKIVVDNLASIYEKEKNFIKAAQMYEKSLDIEPADELTKLNLLRMFYLTGHEEQFQNWSQQLLRELKDKKNLVNAGDICVTAKKAVCAFDFYIQALKIDQSYVPAYIKLVKFLEHMNRYDDAVTAVQAGLNLNPQNPQLLDLLSKIKKIHP
ncbi:MAG: tetratricopeptide repeat protein [Candidatus Omnitrophica bacterium]|nr:tetratricopeptide repeat protein [Candidatus Omnitrophota bacterium]